MHNSICCVHQEHQACKHQAAMHCHYVFHATLQSWLILTHLDACCFLPFACSLRQKADVFLQVNYKVSQVVLTNRQECCRCPLAGANIYIGNPSNLNVIATDNPDLSKETTWQLCATVRALQAVANVAHLPNDHCPVRPWLCKASCAPVQDPICCQRLPFTIAFCNVMPLAFQKPDFLLHPCLFQKVQKPSIYFLLDSKSYNAFCLRLVNTLCMFGAHSLVFNVSTISS